MSRLRKDRLRPRAASRWIAIALALGWGLGSGIPAASGQPADTQNADFEVSRGKKKNRKRQSRPIMLGTSGSNVESMEILGNFLYCCSGTLGALVEKDGIQYLLSNNHVIARSNSGKSGEPILQPGYSDQSCPAEDEAMDTVAHLTSKKKVKFGVDSKNKADVAIAEVVPGAVESNGRIVHIGVPGATPADAFIGMPVKKSGRSTGLTRGVVVAVDNTVQILDFPLDCAETETRVARFTDQIFVQSINGKPFDKSGDSGSMVYEDVDQCPAPVGLLFAGNSQLTALSPASTVLKTVKRLKPRSSQASFVGCESAQSEMEVSSTWRPILRPERVRDAAAAKDDWEREILGLPGVQSVGVGMALSGPVEPAIYVYTTENREAMIADLPATVNGFRIEVIETEPFRVTCGQQELAYSRK